jgi:hypothetical protein
MAELIAHLPTVLEAEGSKSDAHKPNYFFVCLWWLLMHTNVLFEHHVRVRNNYQNKTL